MMGLLKRLGVSLLAAIFLFLFITSSVFAGPLDLNNCDITDIIAQHPSYSSCEQTIVCSSDSLVGSDYIEQTLNFLRGHGLTLEQAAGVIGNLEQESGQGLDPSAEQQPGQSWTNMSNAGGYAVGIVQWDGSRRPTMINYAESTGGLTLQDLKTSSSKNLQVQLVYMWQELTTSYPGTYSQLQKDTDYVSATTDFMNGYESPGAPHLDNRIKFAKDVVDQYSGSQSATSSQSNCAAQCNSGGTTATANLSQVRQNVVCIAQQELKTWQAGVKPNIYCKKYMDGLNQPNWCEEWCADFVSWVYNQAAYPFTGGQSGGWRFSAVQQIYDLAQADKAFHWHPKNSGYTPRPGDIVIYNDGSFRHTNIVVAVSGNTVTKVGGDQGSGPYGGPNSASVVSQEGPDSFYGGDTYGYVSPD